MGPIDYTSAFADVPAPGASFLQGVQGGAGIAQLQLERQQKQLAAQQTQQQRADLAALSQNPTPQAIAAMMLKYPSLSEQLKRGADVVSSTQQQGRLDAASQVYAALQSNAPDVALNLLKDQATAARNSGSEQDAKAAETMAQLVKDHPEFAKTTIGLRLAAAVGPEKFAESFAKLGGEQRAGELQGDLVRKGAADADEAESDVALKNLSIVAQKAGALAKPGVKPSQAQAMFRTLAARGIIPKDELQGYLDGIPADQKALPNYLRQVQASGMKADDQMKYTTPDANSRLSADTQVKTTGMNNRTQLAVQDRIDARQEAKGDVEPTLSPATLKSMAQQYLAGDPAAIQNLGRGAQGAANLVAVRNEIAKLADERGMDGAAIAAKLADYGGLKAGLRTSAQISARVENAISEAKELAPLAIEASKAVSRSGLLPFGKAQIMFDTQTNDPALKKFATANNGLVSAYAGAMARGQKPTVSDYDHAREILAAAQSHEAYVATVNQMYAEMAAASRAPQNVREHLRNEISGGKGGHGAATTPSPFTSGWSVERVN